ncbi:MAG: methionyl-tRNA formyltransferase [Clostridia bacterium]|nr:methionyl-tRNA formyltransferase [Clostridia bacterium]
MKIIFLGTPDFAIPSLDKIFASHHELLAVITQVDKPSGRGNKLTPSPVKVWAKEHNVKVLQYEKISRDGLEDIKNLQPDIMVTAAYGQILSQSIIDIPKYGIINVHASLLPKYRGAAPIQAAIINGETYTGVTIMQTEAGLDTGDILSMGKTTIGEEETAGELAVRLAEMGSELLLMTLEDIEQGTTIPEKQQHSNATITKKIKKEECMINWNKSAKELKCMILGTSPDPMARTSLNGELVKIARAKENKDIVIPAEASIGEIIAPSSAKNGVFVKCGQGVIEILEAQFPGGKLLTAKQLYAGRKFQLGDQFQTVMLTEE